MKINKSYKFRLRPTKEQEQQLLQHGGNTRFLWNFFLDLNRQEYEKTGKFIFGYNLIMSLPKLKEEYDFLSLSIAQSLQQVGWHFDQALKDFLNLKQKNFPVCKKHKKCDSFKVPQDFKIGKKYIHIPKIGKIRWKKHRVIKGKPKHITIKQDGEHWYCSVCCELEIKQKEVKVENIIGIDVGLKTYATHSDGETIENPKTMKKWEKKLKRTQRRLSKKKKDSSNRKKQRKRLARVHRKVRNIRRDFQHKKTHWTITKYDGVVLENLNIQGMMSNHYLAKAIADCGWYEYKRQLKYKALWSGKVFIEIDRFEPTSKKCSECGWIDHNLSLKDRIFKCKCGLEIDRDLNAAINIRKIGLRILWDTQESTARKGTLVENGGCRASAQCHSLKQEQKKVSYILHK